MVIHFLGRGGKRSRRRRTAAAAAPPPPSPVAPQNMVALGSRLAIAGLAAALRHPPPRCCSCSQFSFSDTSLEALRKDQRKFVEERGWAQFHTPRSLALALMGEVGEVAELLQWRSEDECRAGLPHWSAEEKVRLGEELADVLSYVMRLSDVAEIDLPAAFADKMAKNRDKYPAEQVYGSAAKYTEYRARARGEAAERRGQAPLPDVRQAEELEEQEGPEEREEEEEREGQAAAQGAGMREWGVPANVAAAYARAAARFEQQTGEQAPSVAASEPNTAAAASDDAPARGLVEIDAASWASSVRERARAKASADQNGLTGEATDDGAVI